jgi:hypothetical protein
MNKMDLLYGCILGLVLALVGASLFIFAFTDYDVLVGFRVLRANNALGKLITLGALPNFVAFFVLLRMGRELMARGVVLATIVLAIITLVL